MALLPGHPTYQPAGRFVLLNSTGELTSCFWRMLARAQ